jgi:hypothetical protein
MKKNKSSWEGEKQIHGGQGGFYNNNKQENKRQER